MVADAALYFLSFPHIKQPPEPAGEAYPAPHVMQNPLADVVAGVRPLPAEHAVTVTAAHPFALVPAFHVDPTMQPVHTPSAVVVAGVRPWPAGHVVTVTGSHGSLPETENVEPALHAAALAAGRTTIRRYAATKSLSSNLAMCERGGGGSTQRLLGACAFF